MLLHRAPITRGYSRGAPRSLCHVSGEGHVSRVTNVSLVPRHGYLPQPPAGVAGAGPGLGGAQRLCAGHSQEQPGIQGAYYINYQILMFHSRKAAIMLSFR